MLKRSVAICLLASMQFVLAMDEQPEFFLEYKGQQIKITRVGLENSKKLLEYLEDEDFSNANKLTIPIDGFVKNLSWAGEVSLELLKVFAKFSDSKFDLKMIEGPALLTLINLADLFCATKIVEETFIPTKNEDVEPSNEEKKKDLEGFGIRTEGLGYEKLAKLYNKFFGDKKKKKLKQIKWTDPVTFEPTRDLLNELLKELAARINDEDYEKFLLGEGFLWEIIQKLPKEMLPFLKKELFPGELYQEINFFEPPKGKIISWLVLPDGRIVVGLSKGLCIWDPKTDQKVMANDYDERVRALLFLGKDRFVSSSTNGTLRIWNTAGVQLKMHKHESGTVIDFFLLDQKTLAAVLLEGDILLWFFESQNEKIKKLEVCGKLSNTLFQLEWRFSAKEKLAMLSEKKLAMICSQKLMRVVNWKKDSVIGDLKSEDPLKKIILLDKKTLAIGTADGKILILRSRNFESVDALQLSSEQVGFLTARPGSIPLLAAVFGNRVYLINWKGKRDFGVLSGHERDVTLVLFFGYERVASVSMDQTMRIWNWRTTRELAQLKLKYDVEAIALMPNGTLALRSRKKISIRETLDSSFEQAIFLYALRLEANRPEKRKNLKKEILRDKRLKEIFYSLSPRMIKIIKYLGVLGLLKKDIERIEEEQFLQSQEKQRIVNLEKLSHKVFILSLEKEKKVETRLQEGEELIEEAKKNVDEMQTKPGKKGAKGIFKRIEKKWDRLHAVFSFSILTKKMMAGSASRGDQKKAAKLFEKIKKLTESQKLLTILTVQYQKAKEMAKQK